MNHSDSTTIINCRRSTCDYHWRCALCRMCFIDKFSLNKHKVSFHDHLYVCKDIRCRGRGFRSPNGLREHLRQAAVHREYDAALCVLCGQQFNSTHNVLLHLDMGGCKPITWRSILRQAKIIDKGNDFVDPDIEVSKFKRVPSWYKGTRCATCRKTFDDVDALNRHRASPVHQPRLLMCPVAGCGSRFSTLSGLAQHMEMGTKRCAPMRDHEAWRKWEKFLDKMGLVKRKSYH